MANTQEETVRLVRIDTGDSIKTVAELKKYIKELKDGIEKLEIGSEEYNDTLKALKEAQDAQRDSMHFGVETVKAAKGSYNDLVHTMRELKEQWRATSDESERSKLGFQINDINNQLKELDASVGVYGRNVGDYSNKIQEAFVAMGSKAGAAAAGGVKKFKLGLDALSKTPVIAIIGIIITVLEKVVQKMKESEEGTKALSSAMSVLEGISTILGKYLEQFGKVVGWVADQVVKLLQKLKLYSGEMQAAQEITQKEIKLEEKRRETIMKNADAEKAIAELRAKAVEEEKYNLKQRETFLREALALEEERAKRERDLAKDEYDLIVLKNSQLKSGTKDLRAEADAYARMQAADTAFLAAQRKTIKELNALRRQQRRDDKEAVKDAEKASKDEAAALNARLALEKDIISQQLALTKKGTAERLEKSLELLKKEHEIAVAKANQTIKDEKALEEQLLLLRQKFNVDWEQTLIKADEEARDARAQRVRDAFEADMALLEEGSMARLEKELELKEYELEHIHKYEEESEEAFQKRRAEAEAAYTKQQRAVLDARVNMMQTWAGSVTSLMGSVADAYEALSDDEEKAAEETKGMRIAIATIDTISGAVSAFMSTSKQIGGIPGLIAGALAAASVTATGLANIAKIRSVNVKKGSGSGSSASTAVVAAPPAVQQVPVTRTATSASEEERLDRMAANKQRVVLVYSDVKEADNYVEVVQDETEF